MFEAITVEGTWGRKRGPYAWWRWGSEFWRQLESHGFDRVHIENEELKFDWNDSLEGIFGKNTRWVDGGKELFYYIDAFHNPDKKLVVFAHSHGGQVATYTAALGAPIDVLVTMATPVRKDWRKYYAVARHNVKHWFHIHSDNSDWMQWLGSLFDGTWKLMRDMPYAHTNISIPDIGHSGMLDVTVWEQYDLYNKIKEVLNDE